MKHANVIKLLRVLAVAFAGAGCSATTGVDLEIRGADKVIGAAAVHVLGDVEGVAEPKMLMADVPGTPRALTALENVRIVLPDDWADKVIRLTVVLKDGSGNDVNGQTQEGAAVLVRNRTKRIRVCFDPVPDNCTVPAGT